MNVLRIENQPTIEGVCHGWKWNGSNIKKINRQRYTVFQIPAWWYGIKFYHNQPRTRYGRVKSVTNAQPSNAYKEKHSKARIADAKNKDFLKLCSEGHIPLNHRDF